MLGNFSSQHRDYLFNAKIMENEKIFKEMFGRMPK